MKPGLRPPIIGQIFAPVPAARSRCLSAFVAIARQSLPLSSRYEPSHLLGLVGAILIVVGFFTKGVLGFGGMLATIGWCSAGLAILATLGQDRIAFGKSRSRLIRQLDEIRRSVGLDRAILPESLEFLETTAQHWERIEHTLEAQIWREQAPLRARIANAAQRAMEDIVILECGSTGEAGLEDSQANDRLTETAAGLALLADRVDAVSTALTTPETDGILQREILEETLTALKSLEVD